MNSIFEIPTPFGWEFYVPAYALFSCIGLFLMMLLLYFRVRRMDMSFVDFLLMIIFMVVGVIIGSKFLFILTKIPDIIKDFSFKNTIIIVITSGFVFYGGLFGAILGLMAYSKFKKLQFGELADVVAPGMPLFHSWGRIGCFFAGCCYGKKADWGFALEVEPGILRIPIQLIESFLVFLIFALLLLIERKCQKHYNLLFWYLFLYSIVRIVTEVYRDDTIRGVWFGVSTSQWISLFMLLYLTIFRVCKREQIIHGILR